MAIEIDKSTAISATTPVRYWKIAKIELMPKSAATVELHGYWTQADREAGAMPVTTSVIVLPQADQADAAMERVGQQALEFVSTAAVNAFVSQIYASVKQNPSFASAVDVMEPA